MKYETLITPDTVGLKQVVKSNKQLMLSVTSKVKLFDPTYPVGSVPQFQLADSIVPLNTSISTDLTLQREVILAQQSATPSALTTCSIFILSQQLTGVSLQIRSIIFSHCSPLVNEIETLTIATPPVPTSTQPVKSISHVVPPIKISESLLT